MSDNNDSSQQRTFQVLDRRRFDSEGRERPDDSRTVEGAAAAQTAPAGTPQPTSPTQPPPVSAGADRGAAARVGPEGAHVYGGAAERTPDFRMEPQQPEDEGGVSFLSFVMSLATQAMVQLGEMEPPEGMEMMVDLEAGRQSIDLLSMLQRKTRGNLTAEEARLFEDVLHGLRVSYLRRAR